MYLGFKFVINVWINKEGGLKEQIPDQDGGGYD